jgi:hypothetical protein
VVLDVQNIKIPCLDNKITVYNDDILNNNVVHKAECLDNVEGKRANVTCGPGFGIDSKLAKFSIAVL